jgi:hypothetical protein
VVGRRAAHHDHRGRDTLAQIEPHPRLNRFPLAYVSHTTTSASEVRNLWLRILMPRIAARGLLRDGHDVTVFQQRRDTRTGGGAVTIWSNGEAVLWQLGVDMEGACQLLSTVRVVTSTGRRLSCWQDCSAASRSIASDATRGRSGLSRPPLACRSDSKTAARANVIC